MLGINSESPNSFITAFYFQQLVISNWLVTKIIISTASSLTVEEFNQIKICGHEQPLKIIVSDFPLVLSNFGKGPVDDILNFVVWQYSPV